MDMQVIISQMAVLFILIAAGYVAGKIKMLTAEGVKTLSKVVINISTPCTIMNSVLSNTSSITGGKTASFMLIVLIAYLLYSIIALPAARILSINPTERGNTKTGRQELQYSETSDRSPDTVNPEERNRGLYGAMIIFGNVGFMGFPITYAIFGDDSVFYVAIVNILFNMLVYTVGIIMISGDGRNVKPKVLLNATLVSSVISFIIVFTGISAPSVITETIKLAANINTPCAMLVIGATLAQISPKNVIANWRLYPITLLKMIIIPFITWLLFKQFITDPMLLGLLVVLSGMPVAAAVAMIPIEYGGDASTASSAVFLTTVLSTVTIPLIVYVFLL